MFPNFFQHLYIAESRCLAYQLQTPALFRGELLLALLAEIRRLVGCHICHSHCLILLSYIKTKVKHCARAIQHRAIDTHVEHPDLETHVRFHFFSFFYLLTSTLD